MVPEEEEELLEQPEQPQPEEQKNQEEDQHQYPRRQRIAPSRYGIDEYVDTAFLGGGQRGEPQSIEEALEGKLSKKWKEATDSNGRKPIGWKWIFKTKRGSDGKVEHYKA